MATQLVTLNADTIQARINDLMHELAVEQEKLAELLRPTEPPYLNTVVRFRKYNGEYTFAAIKARYLSDVPHDAGEWYLTQAPTSTGKARHTSKTWPELLDWIGERNWGSIEVLS